MRQKAFYGYFKIFSCHCVSFWYEDTALYTRFWFSIWCFRIARYWSGFDELLFVSSKCELNVLYTAQINISIELRLYPGLSRSSQSRTRTGRRLSKFRNWKHGSKWYNTFQIPLTDTIIDTAKSSIVYSVTRGVSTASRAVSQLLLWRQNPDINDAF